MDFKSCLQEKIDFIDRVLNKYLPDEVKYPQEIYKAMRYSLFAGGKRLRPILLMSSCEMFGGKIEDTESFLAAIEMIHTYSLVHDDLPAMDNDDLRRGMPTNHKVFGEDIAILAGDGLLNTAFEIMIGACIKSDNKNLLLATSEIGKAAGVKGMIGGQVVDVITEGKEIDEDTLDFIHKNKTGAMIVSAIKAGAMIANAGEQDIRNMEIVGDKIGLAFQIQDDILDIISTDEVLGKPTHSDEKNKKNTYVTMYGMDKAMEDVATLSNEALEILNMYGVKSEFFSQLTKYLINRQH